jgi:type II secretion system protein G
MDIITPRRAFTLIELLIVVAIIAILAAIAVPNFLEAQVRSKVSRVKADMRTVATALESYRVDNSAYPPAYAALGSRPGVDSTYRTINPRIQRLVPVTTPIAYITSVPEDVFNTQESTIWATKDTATYYYADRESYTTHVPNALQGGGGAIYAILWRFEYPNSVWLMRSRGPVGGEETLGSQVRENDAYDPTNGTVSNGNIFLLGSGIGFLGE